MSATLSKVDKLQIEVQSFLDRCEAILGPRENHDLLSRLEDEIGGRRDAARDALENHKLLCRLELENG